ncbi:MAG: serine kinase [Pontixanthobacter sp.]
MSVREHLLQYTAVAIGGRGLLIGGAPGAGKTSLALCLIDRGAVLIGDDGVALNVKDGWLHAAPPHATAGKLELRNVGIARLPCTAAPVALSMAIDPNAPRFVERAQNCCILGIEMPHIRIAIGRGGPNLADVIRVERAIAMHGETRDAARDPTVPGFHDWEKRACSAVHD